MLSHFLERSLASLWQVNCVTMPVIYHDTSRSHCTLKGHRHWSPTQMAWQCPFKKAAFPWLLTAQHPALVPYQKLLVLMNECFTLEFINSLTSSITNVHSLSSNALSGLESFKKFSKDKIQLLTHSSIPEHAFSLYLDCCKWGYFLREQSFDKG